MRREAREEHVLYIYGAMQLLYGTNARNFKFILSPIRLTLVGQSFDIDIETQD